MWFWLSRSTFCFSMSTQQAGRSKHIITKFRHAWDTGKESGFFISSTTRHYRMYSCLWCLLLIHYRFRNTEMVATLYLKVRSWAEEKVVLVIGDWTCEEMRILSAGLQVWSLQKCGLYKTKWLFIHHSLPTFSQDWEASICALQRACGLVMAFCCLPLSTSYGTITKYSYVCYVFILCTLHPPCLCYSIIVWLASL